MTDLNVIRQDFFITFFFFFLYPESENILVQEQFHVSQVAGVLAEKMALRGGNISQNYSVACMIFNPSAFTDSMDCFEITVNFVL